MRNTYSNTAQGPMGSVLEAGFLLILQAWEPNLLKYSVFGNACIGLEYITQACDDHP